jgi:hypothetical protein
LNGGGIGKSEVFDAAKDIRVKSKRRERHNAPAKNPPRQRQGCR